MRTELAHTTNLGPNWDNSALRDIRRRAKKGSQGALSSSVSRSERRARECVARARAVREARLPRVVEEDTGKKEVNIRALVPERSLKGTTLTSRPRYGVPLIHQDRTITPHCARPGADNRQLQPHHFERRMPLCGVPLYSNTTIIRITSSSSCIAVAYKPAPIFGVAAEALTRRHDTLLSATTRGHQLVASSLSDPCTPLLDPCTPLSDPC